MSLPELLSMKATAEASKTCLMKKAASIANMMLVISVSSKVSFLKANLGHWRPLERNDVERADDGQASDHVQRRMVAAAWLDDEHAAVQQWQLGATEDTLHSGLLGAASLLGTFFRQPVRSGVSLTWTRVGGCVR